MSGDERTAALASLRGVFADGYTDDLVRQVLPQVAAALGLSLAIIWAFNVDLRGRVKGPQADRLAAPLPVPPGASRHPLV